jgi:TatD DNase family protein
MAIEFFHGWSRNGTIDSRPKMGTLLIDTHAHLDYPDFASDLPQVLARAEAAGVKTIISVGTNLESSRRAVALSEQYPRVFAAVGWHPTEAHEAPDDVAAALLPLAQHPKAVAIGEIGLDFYRLPSRAPNGEASLDEAYKKKQFDVFRQQLQLAAQCGLNCIIHQRDSLEETLREVAPFSDQLRAVFHCFVNDAATAERIFALRSLVSFTGILTFKNAQAVRDVVQAVPRDRFMLETDCPFLAPMPYRGKRCEPAYIKEIATEIARLRGCSLDELAADTTQTACDFFPRLHTSSSQE